MMRLPVEFSAGDAIVIITVVVLLLLENEMGMACSKYGAKRGMHAGFWWGKPERTRPLGRHRRR
jgi:hypothetical protein